MAEQQMDTPMVFVWGFRIPKENHDKLVDLLTTGHGGMDTQRMHPYLPYTKSRHFFRPEDGGKTEAWFVFDEVDDQASYDAMKEFAADYAKSPDAATHQKFYEEVAALTIEGKFPTPVMSYEVVECRVEFQPWKYRAKGLERLKRKQKTSD